MSGHGTTTAMWRHRKRKEALCDACRPLWNAYMAEHKARVKARTIDTSNVHCREMDKALAEDAPVIVWRKDSHGIFRHVSIDDPHAERESSPLRNQRQQEFYTQKKGGGEAA